MVHKPQLDASEPYEIDIRAGCQGVECTKATDLDGSSPLSPRQCRKGGCTLNTLPCLDLSSGPVWSRTCNVKPFPGISCLHHPSGSGLPAHHLSDNSGRRRRSWYPPLSYRLNVPSPCVGSGSLCLLSPYTAQESSWATSWSGTWEWRHHWNSVGALKTEGSYRDGREMTLKLIWKGRGIIYVHVNAIWVFIMFYCPRSHPCS